MLTKEEVNKIKWYRQSGAGIPFTIGMPFLGMIPFYKKTGFYFPNDLATFLKTENGFTFYHYFNYYLIFEQTKKLFDLVENNPKLFEDLKKDFYEAARKSEEVGLNILEKSVKSTEFQEGYESFVQESERFWADSLFLDFFDPFENKVIEFIFSDKMPEKNQINILLSPDDLSNFQQEQKELLAIYEKSAGKINVEIKQDLREHSQKYYWLKNDYEKVEFLNEAYFEKELKKLFNKPRLVLDIKKGLNKFQETQKAKKNLIKNLGLDEKTIKRLNFFNSIAFFRDERKRFNQIGDYVLIKVIKKIHQEMGVEFEALKYAMPNEINSIIDGDAKILSELKKRNGEGVVVFANKGEPIEVVSGKIAREYFDIAEKTIKASEIKGMTVSPGKAIGTARIILSQADFGKMRKGDVLVASNTRPEYVPIMKKAVAIVTDEGGITSHAAIISRELGIPCITGTQVATRSLKDGDLIDVNANHGLIKIIKKAEE